MYCEPARNGVSCSPTTTSVGTVMRRQRLDDVPVGLPQHATRGPRQSGGIGVDVGGQLIAARQPVEPTLVEVAGVALGHLVPLVAAAVAAIAGTGVDEHEGGDAVGVGDRQLQRQVATERVADERRTLGADVVEDAEHGVER